MVVDIEIQKLEEQINKVKKELVLTVKETGLNSQQTLNCSQRLDALITAYQKMRAVGCEK
ncbi:aspartyl-phosphate phosphatase Spo0E family protein [Calidifontibacillus erzurumensis]|uniref:Aspartyl-phosphate phosphatase Spo0E family protein n=1 Tax=Calidifontibacillus erzurumensis TaxID=2741433 RepID=A0A8J8GGZ7_9BACI|nr:aspartyl-phosphate phosphatase Spo0E family protein [Calidifontibacillus erzurumensis]NSL53202.1 aspartyl-phosphate phosphatase Spo0E family protein [Calidifontibacillus erzurumensis]